MNDARLGVASAAVFATLALGVSCGSGDEASGSTSTGGSTSSSTSAAGGTAGADGGAGGGGGSGLEPPVPTFPDVIGTLTVALTTSTAMNADTDAGIELCLTETDCFFLDTPEVNDRELGETDELHFTDVNLPRSAVDRVVLRTTDDPNTDNDRYTPTCLHLRFDGEPVYCNDLLDVHIGTGSSAKEVVAYSDPEVLHETCRSCWTDDTLTHGPMIGAPGATTTPIWLRADATRVVGLRVGDSPDLAGAPIVAWALPSPGQDYTTTLDAPVATGQTAYYRVEIDGDSSQPIRPLRAQLPASAPAVRFAYGSCTQYRPSPGFNAINALDPDLFFFIGDNHYGNVQHVDAHRWHYRRMRRIPERAGLMSVTPTLAIWDDHDFLANNSHGACARREHALEGFSEYWANPAYGTPATPGVFFRHREGPMELFALDCRMYRPDVNDPVSYCELDPSPPTLPMASGPIGPAQMQWLLQEVASSDAPFKLLACGSRFTTEGGLDSWATFPEALATVHDGLDAMQAEGVVFLSGDIHRSRFRINPRPSGYPIPELTSSPLSRTPPASTTCAAEPGELFCYRGNSFVVLDITTDDLTGTIYDEDGVELYTLTIAASELSY